MIKDYDGFITGFGKRLAEAREARGMTQSHLARVMATSASVILRYEKCGQLPRTDKLYELCEILKVSADWLMGRFENG